MSAPLVEFNGSPVEAHTQASLARRCGVNRSTAGRWIITGRIKPVHADHSSQYFATADLDQLRAEELEQMRLRISRLEPDPAKALVGFFSELSANEAGHRAPDAGDIAEGARKAALAAKFDAQADAVAMRIDSIIDRLDTVGRPPADRLRLRAVNPREGLLKDVVIATAGVLALGKFIFVDRDGKRVLDPKQAVRKLQVFTDDKTLETLMAAFEAAGNKVKTRVDHNDAIEARAGWTENPRRVGDTVIADVTLLEAFPQRDLVLEIAERTPSLMAMSIDMVPSFEIQGDRAFMRITELEAVDLVDTGAICPAGL